METVRYPFNSSMPTSTGLPVSAPLMLMLESTIPGFSLISGFLQSYLHIDLSQYLGALLLVVGFATGGRYFYDQFFGSFNQYFTCCAEIKYNDEAYNYIMHWISMNNMSKKSTHFIAGTQTNSSQVYAEDSDVEELPEDDEMELTEATAMRLRNWDRMRAIRFTPSTGQHYFRYKGHWMTFNRSQEKDQGFYGVNKTDEISISCYGRNPQILKDLLSEAQLAYLERDGNKTVIYRGIRGYGGSIDDMEWTRCMSRPPRSMSTVVLDDSQKQLIINDVKEYLRPRTKKWYSNRGIPYRRGYLLYGPPGTGKTSLCFALAGLLHLPIYVASLNSKNISEEGLASLFRDLPSRCIVLLEDIDSAGLTMKRGSDASTEEKTDESEKKDEKAAGPIGPQLPNATPATVENKGISLSGFLNIIDGVASSEGRVLVMTTNHIENLDPALLRPGRVDLSVHFGYATAMVLKGLFMAIYSSVDAEKESISGSAKKEQKPTVNGSIAPITNGTVVAMNGSATNSTEKLTAPKYTAGRFLFSHGKSEEEIEVLAEEFARKVPANVYSPAEIQGFLLGHKTNPEAAIQEVEGWLEVNKKKKAASMLVPALSTLDTLPGPLLSAQYSPESLGVSRSQSTIDQASTIPPANIEPDDSSYDTDESDLNEYPDFIARLLEEQRSGNRSASDLRSKLQELHKGSHQACRWTKLWNRILSWITLGTWQVEEAKATNEPKTLSTPDIPLYVFEYAPYCWLYSGEPYWPTRLETFLDHTQAFHNYSILPEEIRKPTADNIASNLNQYGKHVYLTSDDDPDEYPYWMEGAKYMPDEDGFTKAECFLVVVDKGEYVDAFWFFFYAFNLGNQVLGVRFGNHVGDWEHTAVRFNKKTGKPENVYYSEHEWGAAFWYKDVEKSKGGKRPYTYSAIGTHAMYPTAGDHIYVLPFHMLKDVTDRGYLWDPLQNLRMYVYEPDSDTVHPVAGEPTDDNDAPEAPPSDWFHFIGHWGDKRYPLSDPRQWYFAGELHYTSGPTGPKDKNLGRKYICLNPGDCEMKEWPPAAMVISEDEWERYKTVRYDGQPPETAWSDWKEGDPKREEIKLDF